jgi:hypothetical protein
MLNSGGKNHTPPPLQVKWSVPIVDLEKAYDSIWREGLMVKLYNMGIKGKI